MGGSASTQSRIGSTPIACRQLVHPDTARFANQVQAADPVAASGSALVSTPYPEKQGSPLSNDQGWPRTEPPVIIRDETHEIVKAGSLSNRDADIDRSAALESLRQLLGARLLTGRSVREQHCHTTTIIAPQPPDAVTFPQNANDVSDIVKICAQHRMPVIGYGTGTSLEGHVNAPLGGVAVDFSEMNRVLAINQEDLDCVIEPGVTRRALNRELRDTGLFFAIDPGADASLGGMAATRASGTNAVRYGTIRENVLALKAVMADGSMISTGRRARKSAAGYDLTHLMVGSEGTLGLITELTLRLHGIPETICSARCSFVSVHDACQAVIDTIQLGVPVARIELLDELTVRAVNEYSQLSLPETPLLLLEFHGSSSSVEEQANSCGDIFNDHGGSQFQQSVNPEERNRLWRARHDAYWAQLRLREGAKAIATDACVPISCLAECVVRAQQQAQKLEILAPIVGHVGDGNFHMALLIDPDNKVERNQATHFIEWLAELAVDLGGTCTGEHGIGQGKMSSLRKETGNAYNWMGRIKRAFDPHNIMNPGKLVDWSGLSHQVTIDPTEIAPTGQCGDT